MLWVCVEEYVKSNDYFIFYLEVGVDFEYYLLVVVIIEIVWYYIFVKNMFIEF